MDIRNRRIRRLQLATVLALTACAAVPAVAGAVVGATVLGDDGNPVAITPGLTIRNMSTKVGVAIPATDKGNYALTIAGPDAVNAASPTCQDAGSSYAPSVDYRGNGAYTVTVTPHAANDYACSAAATGAAQVFAYTVGATVGLTGPPAKILIRKPNSFTTIPVGLPITLSPGSLTTEVAYASGAVIGPDGGISGPSQAAYVDTTTGTVPLSLTKPGTYTVVAREKGFSTASGNFYTPWTPPVTVVAVAPFDLESLRFPDSRGPGYSLRGQIHETTATGKVTLAMARGAKGGKYHGIGTAKINGKGVFTKRFTQHRFGVYRVRVKYSGSSSVAGGTIVAKIKISKHYFL